MFSASRRNQRYDFINYKEEKGNYFYDISESLISLIMGVTERGTMMVLTPKWTKYQLGKLGCKINASHIYYNPLTKKAFITFANATSEKQYITVKDIN